MKRKSLNKDFSASLLPKNRREQFFDLIKTRGIVIFKLIIFFILGSSLILLTFGFKYFGVLSQASILITDKEELLAFIRTNSIIFDAVYIIGIILFFIALAGAGNVIKKMCWGENISFIKDIKNGIKNNWKQFLVVGIIFGIIRFTTNAFSTIIAIPFVKYIPYALFILIMPIFFMSLSIGNIYKSRIFEAFFNGTAYCLKSILKVLLFLLIPIICKIVSYVVNDYYAIPLLGGGLLLLLVILMPLICISWNLFSLSLFDKFTNQKYFPDYYHKGLFDSKYLNEKRTDIFLLK